VGKRNVPTIVTDILVAARTIHSCMAALDGRQNIYACVVSRTSYRIAIALTSINVLR